MHLRGPGTGPVCPAVHSLSVAPNTPLKNLLHLDGSDCGPLAVYIDSSISASRFASHLLELVVL